jgi:predicted AlkP superfamily pyrophosphatase or phosphodiesterase
MLSRRTLLLAALAAAPLAAAGGPKLVVVLTVDQFRYDYLERFGDGYRGGIARLLKEGAVFTNAHFEHAPTATAVGHSVIFTGAFPSSSGIVGNEWYDRASKRQVTSVSDDSVTLLGAPGTSAASPRRLLAPTVGDVLKRTGKSRVISISLKDRSAILPGGRASDAAYWYDTKTGNVVSSSYYMKELPAWVVEFNTRRLVDQYAGRDWTPLGNGPPLVRLPPGGPEYFNRLTASPFGNELLVELAQAAVRAEKLGRGPATDLLSVSFSSNDYVGHRWGPDSPHVRDVSLRTDLLLGAFLQFLDSEVGRENLLLVFTSDHGVAPIPEELPAGKGGRISEKTLFEAIEKRLGGRFGEGPWVVGRAGPAPYLDHERAAQRKVPLAALRREAAEALRQVRGVARVYTAEELASGRGGDEIDRRVRNGYHAERSPDLFPVAERLWVFGSERASHGSPYDYDAHVPVIFLGPGIRAGRYDRRIALNDVAPTLAALLGLRAPEASAGKPLREVVR